MSVLCLLTAMLEKKKANLLLPREKGAFQHHLVIHECLLIPAHGFQLFKVFSTQ
jgi:hypothetical protein